MTVTIDLSEDELSLLRQLTHRENDSDAVASATREFLRLAQLKQLKAVSGKVEFEDLSESLEAQEFEEMQFPS